MSERQFDSGADRYAVVWHSEQRELRRRGLTSLAELEVWLVLRSHAGESACAWPTTETISEESGVPTRSVKRALAKLRELGVIVPAGRRGRAVVYEMLDLRKEPTRSVPPTAQDGGRSGPPAAQDNPRSVPPTAHYVAGNGPPTAHNVGTVPPTAQDEAAGEDRSGPPVVTKGATRGKEECRGWHPEEKRKDQEENSHSGDSLPVRTKEPGPAPADAGDVPSPVGEEPEAAPTPPAAARTDPSRDADLDPGDLDYGIDRLLELPGWLDQLSTSPLIRRRYTERLARQYAVVHGAASLATWADVAIELNVQAQNEKRPFHAAAWAFAHVRGFAGGWEPKARDGSPRKFQEAVLACDPDAAMLAWRWSRACQAEERSAEVKATVDRDLQKLRSVDSVVAGELDDLEAHWKARAAEVA